MQLDQRPNHCTRGPFLHPPWLPTSLALSLGTQINLRTGRSSGTTSRMWKVALVERERAWRAPWDLWSSPQKEEHGGTSTWVPSFADTERKVLTCRISLGPWLSRVRAHIGLFIIVPKRCSDVDKPNELQPSPVSSLPEASAAKALQLAFCVFSRPCCGPEVGLLP